MQEHENEERQDMKKPTQDTAVAAVVEIAGSVTDVTLLRGTDNVGLIFGHDKARDFLAWTYSATGGSDIYRHFVVVVVDCETKHAWLSSVFEPMANRMSPIAAYRLFLAHQDWDQFESSGRVPASIVDALVEAGGDSGSSTDGFFDEKIADTAGCKRIFRGTTRALDNPLREEISESAWYSIGVPTGVAANVTVDDGEVADISHVGFFEIDVKGDKRLREHLIDNVKTFVSHYVASGTFSIGLAASATGDLVAVGLPGQGRAASLRAMAAAARELGPGHFSRGEIGAIEAAADHFDEASGIVLTVGEDY